MSAKTAPKDSKKSTDSTRYRGRAIGGILVDEGRLSLADITPIQIYAAKQGLRFGEAAVEMKLLTEQDVEFALSLQYSYPTLPGEGMYGVSDAVVAARRPLSDEVEHLRALRSQLTYRWLKVTTRRTLAITSAERGEGRSYLAANLATLFAHSGERTLLIDADMRHSSQHELFNISNGLGLSGLLSGRAGTEAICRIHPQLRLFVLTAGALPPNPQELLGSWLFEPLLDRLAKLFTVIILDTPAATEAADAQIAAANAGSAVLVARRNHTRHSKLAIAMKTLTSANVKIVGSVINDY